MIGITGGKPGRSGRVFRIAGTLLCFGYIAWNLEPDKIVDLVAHPNWTFLLLCVALTPPLILTSVWRWMILLRAKGVDTPFGTLLRIYVTGTFFNQIAPSTIGADVYRVHSAGKLSIPTHVAAASVFADRVIGFLVLIFALITSWLFIAVWTGNIRWLILAGGVALVVVMTLWWIVSVRTEGLYRNRSGRPPGRLLTFMEKWHTSFQEYRNYPAALVATIALSIVFLVLCGLNFWFAAMTFESGVEIGTVFFIVPTILTLGSLPVSIGGWGLHELSAAVVFDSAGMGASLGLSAALLIRGKNVVLALIGGVLYLLPSKPRKTIE